MTSKQRNEKHLIGAACWFCKHRHSDNWYASRDFCHFYPTLWEREILKGNPCPYYEPDKRVRD